MSETVNNQSSGGLVPDGMLAVGFDGFDGLNTNGSRPAIKDRQMFICDGFMPIGDSWARTLYGSGTSVFNAPTVTTATISFFAFVNVGATPYVIVFTSDGAIWACNTNTISASQIAVPGTIQNPSPNNVGVSQWAAQYILIVANQTNGYFIWDGTTFYASGATVPGTGGGVMPTGIQGTGVTTYQGRVWIINGSTLLFSAAGSYVDFSTGDGGGATPSSDSTLRVNYIALINTNGFLYLIGDSSVSYISGVTQSTSGSVTTTTFSLQNADPQTGTPYPGAVSLLGQDIVLGNQYGVHVSYGGRVTKVSDELDGIYATIANFGGLQPSSASAIIFGKRVWMLLIQITDQVTGQPVNKLMMWDRKKWWTSGQDITLNYIATQEVNSNLTAYGTDGTNIVPLFQSPSTGFSKTLQSKLWAKPHYMVGKAASRLWGLFQYYSNLSPELNVTIDNETSGSPITLDPSSGSELLWYNSSGGLITWTSNVGALIWTRTGTGIAVLQPTAIAQNGALLGLTLQTQAADMAVLSMAIGYEPMQYRG